MFNTEISMLWEALGGGIPFPFGFHEQIRLGSGTLPAGIFFDESRDCLSGLI